MNIIIILSLVRRWTVPFLRASRCDLLVKLLWPLVIIGPHRPYYHTTYV